MSEPKIPESSSEPAPVSSTGPALHAEKDAVYQAGLLSSPWHHIDETETRVNGQNQYCHILCNPLYTAYFTKAQKDRLTVLDVLRNCQERTFRLNAETEDFLQIFGLSERVIRILQGFPQNRDLSQGEFLSLLDAYLPNLGSQQRTHLLDAVSVATPDQARGRLYHTQREWPVIQLLLCDDAGQFHRVTEEVPRT